MPCRHARLFPAFCVLSVAVLSAQPPPAPPVAKKMPKETTLHGVTLIDDYHWLREKGSPEGGSSGRYDRLREMAFRYAFMLDAVGLAQEGATPTASR